MRKPEIIAIRERIESGSTPTNMLYSISRIVSGEGMIGYLLEVWPPHAEFSEASHEVEPPVISDFYVSLLGARRKLRKLAEQHSSSNKN